MLQIGCWSLEIHCMTKEEGRWKGKGQFFFFFFFNGRQFLRSFLEMSSTASPHPPWQQLSHMTIQRYKADWKISLFVLYSSMFRVKKKQDTKKEEGSKYSGRKMTVFAALNFKSDAYSLKTVWIVEKCRGRRDKMSLISPFSQDNHFFTSLVFSLGFLNIQFVGCLFLK